MGKERKEKLLDKHIDKIAWELATPFWMTKIEIADEAGVGNAYDLSEEDIDKMLAVIEQQEEVL